MNLLATGKRACHDKPMCILRITLVSVVLLTCSLPPAASGNTAAQPAAAPNAQEPKKAIEQFLSLTAIWMLELEWTHAYVNKTPKAEDFRKAMLAAACKTALRTSRRLGSSRRPNRAATTPPRFCANTASA